MSIVPPLTLSALCIVVCMSETEAKPDGMMVKLNCLN